ncbi:MAG: hypothetical protein H0U86_02065 [Chloroflexi bacterium]|nr:hypothetical protein [Chloroflexota bacterium]
MSLIGVDVGTSGIKAAAYTEDGRRLATARHEIVAHHEHPGEWEIDVNDSLTAFNASIRVLTTDPAVRRDPPTALGVSASGREVFPVAADGTPLGPCLASGDLRGEAQARVVAGLLPRDQWVTLAGHVPGRMDPVSRALWWLDTQPSIAAHARWFLNWHDFYVLRLTGRAVADRSGAAGWAAFDLESGGWAPERLAATRFDPKWLPHIQSSGTPIDTIRPRAARDLGLPGRTLIVTGAFDTIAAALGTGAVDRGLVALASGTWHTLTTAVDAWGDDAILDLGSLIPHPGPTGLGLIAANPNGTSVTDWARRFLRLSVRDIERGLRDAGSGPSPVTADVTLTPVGEWASEPWAGGSLARLTLATSGVDILRSIMEGVAAEFARTIGALRRRNVCPTLVRASGGGARSSWWLQLEADLADLPIEVTTVDEAGTYGAAMLAGIGADIYSSPSAAIADLVRVRRRFEPQPARAALYRPVLARRERRAADS